MEARAEKQRSEYEAELRDIRQVLASEEKEKSLRHEECLSLRERLASLESSYHCLR